MYDHVSFWIQGIDGIIFAKTPRFSASVMLHEVVLLGFFDGQLGQLVSPGGEDPILRNSYESHFGLEDKICLGSISNSLSRLI